MACTEACKPGISDARVGQEGTMQENTAEKPFPVKTGPDKRKGIYVWIICAGL